MTPTRTTFTARIRPLMLTPFRKVRVYSPLTDKYETFKMERGEWYDVFFRPADQRFTFTSGKGHRRALTQNEIAKLIKQYKRLGFAVEVTQHKLPLYSELTGDLDADSDVLKALNLAAHDAGVKIHVTSGKRSYSEQVILYALYLAGKGNLAAKPGTSNHQKGRSIDGWVGSRGVWDVPKLAEALKARGFKRDAPSEAWHASLL